MEDKPGKSGIDECQESVYPDTQSRKTSFQQIVALLQPTPDGGLVACILVREVALEKSFFSWDHNRRHEADRWHER
jgi:hypothetical protein